MPWLLAFLGHLGDWHACTITILATLFILLPLSCAAAAGDDDCRLVLAIDEAQLLYNVHGSDSQNFFTALKRLDPTRCNVRLLIAAAYGAGASSDSQTGRPDSPMATPGDVDTSESITIHPGNVSLQLDPEDVAELWCAWKACANLQLEDMVRGPNRCDVRLTGDHEFPFVCGDCSLLYGISGADMLWSVQAWYEQLSTRR